MDATTAGAMARRHQRHHATDLVRWGPVVAGVVVGLGFFALFGAMWIAIAAGNLDGGVASNIEWLGGATAIVALLIAGFVAGLLAGVRGAGAGLANGVTTWGLLVVLSLFAGVPAALGLTGALDLGLTPEQALWSLFWSLLLGLACATAGGLLGGLVHRPVLVAGTHGGRETTDEPEVEDAPAGGTWMTGNRVVEERPTAPQEADENAPAVGHRHG